MVRKKKQVSKTAPVPMPLRIVGGRFRGHKLIYHGDPITRPMKHRLREAIFNLIGPSVKERHVIDLFAGTGALGLEAISRGAPGATFVERHFPTADVIEKNIEHLAVSEECTVTRANAFVWIRTNPDLPTIPWLVLCSPPYDFYVDQPEKMLGLISHFVKNSPGGSLIAVEADNRFLPDQLPDTPNWDVRHYPPATIAMYHTMASTEG